MQIIIWLKIIIVANNESWLSNIRDYDKKNNNSIFKEEFKCYKIKARINLNEIGMFYNQDSTLNIIIKRNLKIEGL